jgi:hypothetical protein
MMSYLDCIKKVKGVNEDECRMLAKSYLTCRMDRYVVYYQPPRPCLPSSPRASLTSFHQRPPLPSLFPLFLSFSFGRAQTNR